MCLSVAVQAAASKRQAPSLTTTVRASELGRGVERRYVLAAEAQVTACGWPPRCSQEGGKQGRREGLEVLVDKTLRDLARGSQDPGVHSLPPSLAALLCSSPTSYPAAWHSNWHVT